jgi:hypothetical protein
MALSSSSSFHLRQRRLGFWEPEGQRHGLVQIDRSGELGAGLLPLASRGMGRTLHVMLELA